MLQLSAADYALTMAPPQQIPARPAGLLRLLDRQERAGLTQTYLPAQVRISQSVDVQFDALGH